MAASRSRRRPTWSAASIGLSGVHIELDGNSGEGVLTLANDGRQTLQGTLATELLDLTPYVSTVRLLAGGDRGWDRKPIAMDEFSGMDIDLRLSAARVNVSTVKLGRTAVAANLRGNHLSVAVGESEAFGGVVRGTFSLARSQAGTDLKAQLQFANVDLDQSLGEMFGFRRLEGKGNLGLAIDSSGASVYDLTRALNGTATLVSSKGAITGINVEQLLKRIERSPLSRGNEFRTGKTPYDTLNVGLKIVAGQRQLRGAAHRGPDGAPHDERLGVDPRPRPRSARHRGLDLDRADARVRASLHGAGPLGRPGHAAGCAQPDRALGRRAAIARRAAQKRRARRHPLGDRAVRRRRPAEPAAKPPAETAARPATSEYSPAATETVPAPEPRTPEPPPPTR